MSISDKTITIAENELKVKHAGKLNVLKSANYIQGSVSGEAISVADVNPVEHNVVCNLSSDTIEDFSTVKVQRFGKNLFDSEGIVKKYNDGDYVMNGSYRVVTIPLEPNTKYTIKVNGERPTGGYIFISSVEQVNSSASKGMSITENSNWSRLQITLTTDETGNLYIGAYSITNAELIKKFNIAKVQIEKGEIATEFEECFTTEYIPNTDGTVEGIKSIYPSMTILTDTEGVTITAEYIKDIDKTYNELIAQIALSGGE